MQNYESNQIENFPSPPIKKDVLPPELLPISPNNPPWNSWTAIGVWVASIIFIVAFPNIFLLPYLMKQTLDLSDQTAILEFAKTDATAVLLQITAIIPAHICTLILAWLVVTRLKKYSFRETLGWRWNGFNFWNCLLILAVFYIMAAVVSHFIPEQENDMERILKSSRAAVYVVAFLATFTAPLVEEVVYRGVLYSAFQRTFKTPIRILLKKYKKFYKLKFLLIRFHLFFATNKTLAFIEKLQEKYAIPFTILIITLIFALVHVPQYWGSPGTIFLICLLSLALTLIRVRTKNLLPCIALHTVFNGSQSLLLILQPYIEKYMETQQSQTALLVHFFK